MKLNEINPHIRYARVHWVPFNTSREISVCYDCRIFFFVHVAGSVMVNGEDFPLQNQVVLYLPPGSHYRFYFDFRQDAKIIVLDFDLDCRFMQIQNSLGTATERTFDQSRLLNCPLPPELAKPVLRVVPQLDRMLTQCTEHFLYKNPYYRERASAILKLSLLEMLQQNTADQQSALCTAVFTYIHENYARDTLTNREIAAHFNYHPDHLSSLIRRQTGMSLRQYIIRYRLQMAKNYLLTTQYDISEIAWRCGFCTAAYFAKCFREHTGITPREYRHQQTHTEL